jgi:hypothetical protein
LLRLSSLLPFFTIVLLSSAPPLLASSVFLPLSLSDVRRGFGVLVAEFSGFLDNDFSFYDPRFFVFLKLKFFVAGFRSL